LRQVVPRMTSPGAGQAKSSNTSPGRFPPWRIVLLTPGFAHLMFALNAAPPPRPACAVRMRNQRRKRFGGPGPALPSGAGGLQPRRKTGNSMTRQKAILSWSCGKDSALALHEVRSAGQYELVSLLTTFTAEYDRSCMHGVRISLVEEQAEAIGLPLLKVFIAAGAGNEEYEIAMGRILQEEKDRGVSACVFGDIFLKDLRRYRENKLIKTGLKALFPLWEKNTSSLANLLLDLGFRARVTSVDSRFLEGSFAGRDFDRNFLESLPAQVDPCGENGEFHTFVYDGPIFTRRVAHSKGEVVFRDNRFYYCDLLPG